MENESEQICLNAPCPMTGGYYVGGGLYVCWFHAMTVPGLLELVHGKALVALRPTLDVMAMR